MEIEIDVTKTLGDNATIYYDKAKKMKKKIPVIKKVVEKAEKDLENFDKKQKELKEKEKQKVSSVRKKEWYEKYHWFYSSEGLLVIGGKDATSNEIIIKKHTENNDIVFHTEMAGSPFFVVKNGIKCGDATKKEAAQATFSYSRAWRAGIVSGEVFYVSPNQVTKEAQSGEYLTRGAFMIYGNKNFIRAEGKIAIGKIKNNGTIIGGPVSAISSKTDNYVEIIPGKEKKSETAKKIAHKLKHKSSDDISVFIPTGGCKVLK